MRENHDFPNVYGISIGASASYVSVVHAGKPVLLGRKEYNTHDVIAAFLLDTEERLTSASTAILKNKLIWAYRIISTSFPHEQNFQCVISHPDWLPITIVDEIRQVAKDSGLDPLRLAGNLSMAGHYLDQMDIGSNLWLAIEACKNGLSLVTSKIGYGVIEVLFKDHYSDQLFGTESKQGIVESCNLVATSHFSRIFHDSEGNPFQYRPEDIDYVLICGALPETELEKIKDTISSTVSISSSSILFDPTACALGCAMQGGVLSGLVKDKLLLDVSTQTLCIELSYHTGIELESSEYGAINEPFTMIPRNTTIPSKKGEELAVYMDPKAELEVIVSASYDHLIGRHNRHARLAISKIRNLTSVRQQVKLYMWLDIDANQMLSQSIEITGCNHHDFDIQSKALSTIIESSFSCTIHNDEEEGEADSRAPESGDEGTDISARQIDDFEEYARNARPFDGTLIFNRVLSFIRDENSQKQKSSNDKRTAINILTTVGAVTASLTGFGAIAGILSLGRLTALKPSEKFSWTPKDIDEVKEVFDLTQKEIRGIVSRLGQPQGRFIAISGGDLVLYSAYFSNTRGAHLISLVCAHQQAQCFTNDKIHELIVSVISETSEELYKQLLMSLYPLDIQLVSIIRSVKAEEAEIGDPNYKLLAKIGTPYRFEYLDKNSFYGYKLPIPPHSDF